MRGVDQARALGHDFEGTILRNSDHVPRRTNYSPQKERTIIAFIFTPSLGRCESSYWAGVLKLRTGNFHGCCPGALKKRISDINVR